MVLGFDLGIGLLIMFLIAIKRSKVPYDWFLLSFFLCMNISDFYEIVQPGKDLSLVHLSIIAISPALIAFHILHILQHKIKSHYYLAFLPAALTILAVLYGLLDHAFFEGVVFRILLFAIILFFVVTGGIILVLSVNAKVGSKQFLKRKWAILLSSVYLINFGIAVILGGAMDDNNQSEYQVLNVVVDVVSLLSSLLVLIQGYRYGILYPTASTNALKSTVQLNTQSNDSDQKRFSRIEKLILEESLYLDGALTIAKVSQKTGINQKYISRAVNSIKGVSFTQYINALRIEHLTEKLNDKAYSSYSIEALANESGFNTISSFNRVFKSIYGVTPSQYRQDL